MPSVNRTNIALVAVFAALIAVFALMPPIFMVGTVPFAIQIIAVVLAPLAIGPTQGALANLLYLVVGIAGLPVFANQKSGIAVILGPTGGYLIGYVLAAFAAGSLASLVLRRYASGVMSLVGLSVAGLVGVVVIHLCGIMGLMLNAKMDFAKALGVSVGFVPLDIAKAIAAAVIAAAIFKAFPRLLAMRW